MATALTAFVPEVSLACPGAPQPLMLNAIRKAIYTLCEESHWLTAILPSVPTVIGTASYTLTPPTDTLIVAVKHLVYDQGKSLYPGTLPDVMAAYPLWQTGQGDPIGFVQPDRSTVLFVPVPSTVTSFVPFIATAPSRATTSVDDRFYNEWLDTVIAGALSILHSTPGVSWANPDAGAGYASAFRAGIGYAKLAARKGNSVSSQRVQNVPF